MQEDELLSQAQERIDRYRAEVLPAERAAEQPSALQLELERIRELAEQQRARRARFRVVDAEDTEELREREERIRAEALSAAAVEQWLWSHGVAPKHRKLKCDPELLPREVSAWARSFPEPRGHLLLCGPPGTGKTTAACWLLEQLYRSGEVAGARWAAKSGRFVQASELFAAVFRKESLDRYQRTALLVIDDWGMAYETDWPLSILDALFDHRWGHELATVVTTNLKAEGKEQFSERYPRIYSRLCDSDGPGAVTVARKDLRRT